MEEKEEEKNCVPFMFSQIQVDTARCRLRCIVDVPSPPLLLCFTSDQIEAKQELEGEDAKEK